MVEEQRPPEGQDPLVEPAQSVLPEQELPVPEELSQPPEVVPAERLAQTEVDTAPFRDEMIWPAAAAPLQPDAAYEPPAAEQPTVEELDAEVKRLRAENTRLQEDLDLYKQVGDGQQEAVQKLMERADEAQVRADAASQQIRRYLLLAMVVLAVSLVAVAFAILVIIRFVRLI